LIQKSNMKTKPFISVIISTYKNPQFLELTLNSYLHQTYRDFEIVIADDGSTTKTADLITKYKKNAFFPIEHVWQKDKGFRLAKVRNSGVKASKGDYLLFTDQDCLANSNLLRDLKGNLSPNLVLLGSRRRFSKKKTEAILKNKNRITDKTLFNLSHPFVVYNIAHSIGTRFGGLTGSNISLSRKTFDSVNGFEEYTGWGAEDWDFGYRLYRKGYKLKYLSRQAYVFHLWHPQKRHYLNSNYIRLYKKMLLK
jgi:glycosyltransferase involved in cell wall biosynthesis